MSLLNKNQNNKHYFNMKKARLLFTHICDKKCPGCCNTQWKDIPTKKVTMEQLLKYDEINITGGEPMLLFGELLMLVDCLKQYNKKVYLYTANPYPISRFFSITKRVDGVTVTIHDDYDYDRFISSGLQRLALSTQKSLRLIYFNDKHRIDTKSFKVTKREWLNADECPVPSDEDFVQLIDE